MTINRWYNSLSPTETRRKVLEDGCQDGLRDTIPRGPKAAVQKTENCHTATFGPFLGLLGFRCECGRCAGRLLTETPKSIDYVQRNRNKKVIYRSFVTNSYNNITTGSSFNALENSGIVHHTAVLICPFIAAVANTGFGDSEWKSPFDTCPSTLAALSLTNLQIAVGGQNVLNSTLNMTYENFLQQVNLAEQFTSSDFGVSTGLISQGFWEHSKWYFVNIKRGKIADNLQPRNINVSFTNNSNVAFDLLIFTF